VLPVATPRLVILAVAGVLLAPIAGWPAVAVWDVALLGAAVADWIRCPRPQQVPVERDAPDVLTRGTAARITWTVTNRGRRPLRVALADELDPALGAPSRRAGLVVPPRGRAHAGVDVRPDRRGSFDLREVTLRVVGPWQLIARQRRLPLAHRLIVLPPFRSRPQTELRLRRARQLQLGERAVRIRGTGLDFDALRGYTVDDEVRRIDWAATARAPQAVARTYQAERNQAVLLLVDCGRTMAALVGGATTGAADAVHAVPRLEHAMDAAQAVTRLATGLGDRVGMVVFSDRVLATLPPRRQADQLRRVTGELATVRPALAESDYRAAFVTALDRFPRRALLMVLTELASEATTQTLLPALGLLRRRHLVVVAAVRDPVIEAWRRTPAATVEESYRRAAAVGTLDRRADVAARLRTAGATVVDAVPGMLAADLSEVYLDTKASGRL
jgi:uncharacterized protein (DUF58 family)